MNNVNAMSTSQIETETSLDFVQQKIELMTKTDNFTDNDLKNICETLEDINLQMYKRNNNPANKHIDEKLKDFKAFINNGNSDGVDNPPTYKTALENIKKNKIKAKNAKKEINEKEQTSKKEQTREKEQTSKKEQTREKEQTKEKEQTSEKGSSKPILEHFVEKIDKDKIHINDFCKCRYCLHKYHTKNGTKKRLKQKLKQKLKQRNKNIEHQQIINDCSTDTTNSCVNNKKEEELAEIDKIFNVSLEDLIQQEKNEKIL